MARKPPMQVVQSPVPAAPAELPPVPVSGWQDAVGEFRLQGAMHVIRLRIQLGAATAPTDVEPIVREANALAALATRAGLVDSAADCRQIANLAGMCLDVGGARGKRMLRLAIDRVSMELDEPTCEEEYASGFALAA